VTILEQLILVTTMASLIELAASQRLPATVFRSLPRCGPLVRSSPPPPWPP
jgi:hypothetical protein